MQLPVEPQTSTADRLYESAMACLAKGEKSQAFEILAAVVDADPRHHQAHVALADLLAEDDNVSQAIECVGMAIDVCPENSAYKRKLVRLVQYMQAQGPNPALKDLLLGCLTDPSVNCIPLGGVWYSVLSHDPDLGPLLEGKGGGLVPALLDPCFLMGLERLLVCNLAFEEFLTALRRSLLMAWTRESAEIEQAAYAPLAKALACYCFRTQYILFCTEEERQAIARIGRELEERGLHQGCETSLLLLACYQPLHGLNNAAAILRQSRDAGGPRLVAELMRLHVAPWLRQQEIRKRISLLSGIDDDVSRRVRAQYEEFPYPQWDSASKKMKHEAESWLRGRKARILVAGCGTGREAIELALALPDSDILAVDLSLTSLSYAASKAQDYGIHNITFRHADILTLGSLDMQFDHIACSGVLHCMRDPLEGWRVLTSLLKPTATMRIALYSRRAREAVTRTREVIAQERYAPDIQGIRQFRRDSARLLSEGVLNDIAGFREYYYLSGCRDLLFHVREELFDLSEIASALGRLGLEFVTFYLPERVVRQYVGEHPEDPRAENLDSWRRFEEEHPRTFKGMYRFWCRKATTSRAVAGGPRG